MRHHHGLGLQIMTLLWNYYQSSYFSRVFLELSPLSLGGGQVKVSQIELHLAQRVIFTHPVPVEELHVERLLANLAPRDLTQKLRTYLVLKNTFPTLNWKD